MSKARVPSYVLQHKLPLRIRPVLVGELYLAHKLQHPAYVFRDGMFLPVIPEGTMPSKDQIAQLIKNSVKEVFLYPVDIEGIKSNLELALVKVTRSLSVGDPMENGSKSLKLISLNMGGLYQNPHSDELLMLQFQSSQNLSKFLLENKRLQPRFFQNLQRENFHFTMTQPMLSSLLLLSFIQSIHLFHEKEIESLFLASYLKDIGFSMIPDDKYDQRNLSPREQDLFAHHANFSYDLLEGRVPLSKNYLAIIQNHHFLNDKLKSIVSKEKAPESQADIILGLESTLIAVTDMIVAMTSDRPYRKSISLYQALELIKHVMADDYPQEFKALVNFLRQFYKI